MFYQLPPRTQEYSKTAASYVDLKINYFEIKFFGKYKF